MQVLHIRMYIAKFKRGTNHSNISCLDKPLTTCMFSFSLNFAVCQLSYMPSSPFGSNKPLRKHSPRVC